VQRLIEDYGLSSDQLSAAGYSHFRPVDTNDTPEGRARNRRVDIVLLNERAAQEEPSSTPPPEESRAWFVPPKEAAPSQEEL
jgi:chemotaxis protein MotB